MSVSPKHKRAIAVLLGGGTNHEAAAAAGVRHETVCRWKQLADFARELADGQAQLQGKTQSDLAALHSKALSRIGDALDDEEVGIRLRAASLIVTRSGQCAPPLVTISNSVSVRPGAQHDDFTIDEALEHIESGPATLVEVVEMGEIDLAKARDHLAALADATAQALSELDEIQKASDEASLEV